MQSQLALTYQKWEFLNTRSELVKRTYFQVLYVNPAGANPTGVSIPLGRRQEIYQIAQEYDLIILEDDPYYFLQFEAVVHLVYWLDLCLMARSFVQDRTPSFLSLDTDGRVIRFDSLSKVLSSGIRLGYVTGPRALIEPISYHMQVSVLHASSLSQVLQNILSSGAKKHDFFLFFSGDSIAATQQLGS